MVTGVLAFLQRVVPQAMTWLACWTLPQNWMEQSRMPLPKFTLRHRQATSPVLQPSSVAWFSMLVAHVLCYESLVSRQLRETR